jgi:hypothetical protein
MKSLWTQERIFVLRNAAETGVDIQLLHCYYETYCDRILVLGINCEKNIN